MEDVTMTDEQFDTYNKLLSLLDELIDKLPTKEEQKQYQDRKNDILLKK